MKIKKVLPVFLTALALTGHAALAQGNGDKPNPIKQRPGNMKPIDALHPGYTIEQARPDDFAPQTGAMAFSPDGKYLAIGTFHPQNAHIDLETPNGTLYILESPTSKDTGKMVVHKIDDQLYSPLGACWIDDGLFVMERNEISKWTDSNSDGIPDKKETFASGWISDNFHHFSFGLPYHDGYFYGALSTSLHMSPEARKGLKGKIIAHNSPNPEFRGCIMKVDAKTGDIEWIAGGMRTPNGLGLGPNNILLAPDNQGDWKPANMIYVVKGGEFFGKYNNTEATTNFYPDGGAPSLNSEKEPTPPAIWLAQNEIGNSPSATLLIPDGHLFAGQVLSADISQGAIHRVFMEEVDGTWQGAVFRHTMGLEAGPNRMAWGPDGCLYVGGMGEGKGNWGWKNQLAGLQRLRPTGKSTFEYEKIEATKDGFRVTFTRSVPKEQLADAKNWLIDAWTYIPRPEYGAPKTDEHQVRPSEIRVANDRKSVELVIKDRKPNYVYHICTDPKSDEGEQMWSCESWVTFHKAPK